MLILVRRRLLPADVTAVTEQKHRNGVEDQMVLARFATLAVCTTLN